MAAPLLAVDAPFLLYRSFFALPESITGIDGRPVGALLGATNAILRVAAEHEPRAVAFCFGAEAADYRVALYQRYHADRPPVPGALAWQFDVAPELFAAFGWSSQSVDGFEADDVLGSLATAETEAGNSALILTGDRDLYQCAADGVTVLYSKMGTSGFEQIDPGEVVGRYGVTPELVPDFIALRGDPSDGLPGAPGIGAKTAAALLERHGSLEQAIAGADAERPRIAAVLRDHADQLRAFKDIATLRHVEVELPGDQATNLAGGAEAVRGLGMRRLAERLESADTLRDL
jgi:5'-3' exonuclease